MPCLSLPLFVLEKSGDTMYAVGGELVAVQDGLPCVCAIAPACMPESLGDRTFCSTHGLRYPCYAGSMAHGIASLEMVAAMAYAGMLGFYGSAGLSIDRLCDAINHLYTQIPDKPFGVNLINSPQEKAWEKAAVDLFIQQRIRLIEASAYIFPTGPLVKFRVTGLHQDSQGQIVAPNKVIAKVSRSEIARSFLEPPPEKLLKKLVDSGEISQEEARLARLIPLAEDITAEADSGGHTDHRAAFTLLPTLQRLRDEIQSIYNYAAIPRIGIAGGIGTPHAAAAAFSMGAAYVVTGSINQACVESGTSPLVREMLAQAGQTDITDAPAADMFEMGVKVQVLKKGTRFPERAVRLYDIFKRYDSMDAIPQEERKKIEGFIFRDTLENIWEKTAAFFEKHNVKQLDKAAADPKHKLALICRWYLGSAVHWANKGVADRKEDFQIWCGPAMGAFNDWARNSYLEIPENRRVADVNRQILYGAALLLREQSLRSQNVAIPENPTWRMPTPNFSVIQM